MKKRNIFLVWFCYCVLLGAAFEITNYLIEHDLLRHWYVVLIEIMFLGLGYLSAKIEYRLNNTKKRRKK